MSSRVRRHILCLQFLKTQKNAKLRKAIIDNSDNDLVCTLCECALNILQENVAVTPQQKTQLRKYKKHLRALASKKVTMTKKRKVLQTGGFLSALLAPLGTVLLPLLRQVIG